VISVKLSLDTVCDEVRLNIPMTPLNPKIMPLAFHYVCDVQARAAEEMLKKVNVFSDMWKNGKISYPVKSTMARLATGLQPACMKFLLSCL